MNREAVYTELVRKIEETGAGHVTDYIDPDVALFIEIIGVSKICLRACLTLYQSTKFLQDFLSSKRFSSTFLKLIKTYRLSVSLLMLLF